MKESMWGYYLILLGITVSTVMIMMSNMTTSNQQDYYLLKEVTNAAMIDAIDFGYYRAYGEVKINTEKFVENFLRRFAQNVSKNNSYKIDFYSIYENPPSVSIKVTTTTGEFRIAGDTANIDVINTYDAILEANNSVNYDMDYYSIPYAECSERTVRNYDSYCKISTEAIFNSTEYYKDLVNKFKEQIGSTFDESKIKVLSSKYLKPMTSDEEIELYNDQFSSTYSYEANNSEVPKYVIDYRNLATIKDVKFAVVDADDGTKRLSWSAKFICENPIDSGEGVKQYRKKISVSSNYDSFYSTSSNYSDTKIDDSYEWTPYYNNCLVGIKYKIIFYYDNN